MEPPSASTSAARAQEVSPTTPPSTARAQDAEPAGYRELVDAAVSEYGSGNHEESRALFARAHQLLPNARTHRGIAMAEFELRNYPACITQLEAALRSRVRPLDPPLRANTEQLLERARLFIGSLVIETIPAPAQIRVDGMLVELTVDKSLTLGAGDHLVEAQIAGRAPERRNFHLSGGKVEKLTIVFGPPVVPSAPHSTHPAPPPVRVERRWYQSPWLWTTVGVLVAGSAATASYLLLRPEDFDRGTSGVGGTAP